MIDNEQKEMPDLKFNRVTIEDDGAAGLSFYKDDSLWCPLTPTEEMQLLQWLAKKHGKALSDNHNHNQIK